MYLYDSIVIEDDVFIGPNVTFTNDVLPRSRQGNSRDFIEHPKTLIKAGASIGGGSTILPGITIGEGAMVGAGSIVAKDVKPNSLIYGQYAIERNPSKLKN